MYPHPVPAVNKILSRQQNNWTSRLATVLVAARMTGTNIEVNQTQKLKKFLSKIELPGLDQFLADRVYESGFCRELTPQDMEPEEDDNGNTREQAKS